MLIETDIVRKSEGNVLHVRRDRNDHCGATCEHSKVVEGDGIVTFSARGMTLRERPNDNDPVSR